jgi:putative ABC transport system permease protein
MLQGTNGALTLGFLVTLGISIIGFLIYWIISIQERLLQFGVLRAIGMSKPKVVVMLVCEHALVSGIPILLGIAIGGITSRLFVPLLQVVYSAAQQVPPFRVVASAGDYGKIYGVVAFMLATGLAVLAGIASRIQIHQAVKLGEE